MSRMTALLPGPGIPHAHEAALRANRQVLHGAASKRPRAHRAFIRHNAPDTSGPGPSRALVVTGSQPRTNVILWSLPRKNARRRQKHATTRGRPVAREHHPWSIKKL